MNPILQELEPLFKKAVNLKLWFYCSYQGMWFSPKELREQHAKGKFIWGAVNWQLRSPLEALERIKQKIDDLQEQQSAFAVRIKNS